MDGKNRPIAWQALHQRLAQAKGFARDASKIVAEEAITWDLFRWAVIVLLILNFVLLVYVGTGSQVTAMHQDPDNYASDELGSLRAQLNKVAAELAAVQFGLRLPTTQSKPEPTTGSIGTPSIPLPTRSPRQH